jgi:adenylyl-sulfate kinase
MSATGFTVWFTGLSGSGKTTLAEALRDRLQELGHHVEVLDSGRMRRELNRSLGWTREEIEPNLKRLGYEAKMLNRNGVVVLVSAVSPYRDARDAIREDVGRFIEVYCRCPMEVLIKRDEHGLFDRASRGEIQHVAGVNAPYEEPFKPEVLINTDVETVREAIGKIIKTLSILGYLEETGAGHYTPEEEEIIKARLKDLGYIE